MQQQQVLVTGGSGYLAGWVIVSLLQQGHRVRTTVRSLDREAAVRAAVGTQVPDAGDRLSFFVADLLQDASWEAAAAGVDGVIHTASPMGVGGKACQDLVRPAREGTRRVLEAAAKAGAKRVVVTSSLLAAQPSGTKSTFDEATWTDLEAPDVNEYARSKTLAERDAWAWSQQHPNIQLTTVLPGFIQGPLLGTTTSDSLQVVSRMLKGEVPATPRLGFCIVDVRDLADLHTKALFAPSAANHRFTASGDYLWMADMARVLRESLGPQAAKVPTRSLPDFAVKAAALFNRDLKEMLPSLGKQRTCEAAKARRLLGWTPRPSAESIVDCGKSLVAAGMAV